MRIRLGAPHALGAPPALGAQASLPACFRQGPSDRCKQAGMGGAPRIFHRSRASRAATPWERRHPCLLASGKGRLIDASRQGWAALPGFFVGVAHPAPRRPELMKYPRIVTNKFVTTWVFGGEAMEPAAPGSNC